MGEATFYINITKLEDGKKYFDTVTSNELLHIFRLVNYVMIAGPVGVFGIIFNIINIVVFIKTRFKDTVNISLLALSVSDLGSILPVIWMSVCYNPLVSNQVRRMDYQAIQVVGGCIHVSFSRITGCLTAFITFERYLCVALPLKIMTIITPKRTVIIVVSIFVIIIAGVIPEYFSFGLHPYINTKTNLTVIGLVYYQNGRDIENFVVLFATFLQLTSFALVIVCTVGLVRVLILKSKWRHSVSRMSDTTVLSSRDRRAVLMVVSISTIFIVSYLPLSVSLGGALVFKDYSTQDRYNNLLVGIGLTFLSLESINSTVNIFIYYNMSSKYRAVLTDMIGLQRK